MIGLIFGNLIPIGLFLDIVGFLLLARELWLSQKTELLRRDIIHLRLDLNDIQNDDKRKYLEYEIGHLLFMTHEHEADEHEADDEILKRQKEIEFMDVYRKTLAMQDKYLEKANADQILELVREKELELDGGDV